MCLMDKSLVYYVYKYIIKNTDKVYINLRDIYFHIRMHKEE